MAISVGALVKGTVGTSLLGGGITTGTLYENTKRDYSDLISKFEAIVVDEIEKDRMVQILEYKKSDSITSIPVTLKCIYWTGVKYSRWPKEKKLLACADGWNKKLEKGIQLKEEQMNIFAQVMQNYEKANFTNSSGTTQK